MFSPSGSKSKKGGSRRGGGSGGSRRSTGKRSRPGSRSAGRLGSSRTPTVARLSQVRKWVRVTRPPGVGIEFTVPMWVPMDNLTAEERREYDEAAKAKAAQADLEIKQAALAAVATAASEKQEKDRQPAPPLTAEKNNQEIQSGSVSDVTTSIPPSLAPSAANSVAPSVTTSAANSVAPSEADDDQTSTTDRLQDEIAESRENMTEPSHVNHASDQEPTTNSTLRAMATPRAMEEDMDPGTKGQPRVDPGNSQSAETIESGEDETTAASAAIVADTAESTKTA